MCRAAGESQAVECFRGVYEALGSISGTAKISKEVKK
jgi:hypothetical protein